MIKAQIFPVHMHNPHGLDTGQWTWHIKSGNGRITCYAGETFSSKTNAKRAFNKFVRSMDNYPVITVEVLNKLGHVATEYEA